MKWPYIAVILPTYNRPDILCRTIEHLDLFIEYSGDVVYLVGNDGDIDSDSLLEGIIGYHKRVKGRVTVLDGPRKLSEDGQRTGLGANLNMLLKYGKKNGFVYFMQLDDDHQLLAKMPLDNHIKYLAQNVNAGWIRLYGVANHCLDASLNENYWWVSWHSSGDYSLYIPSNRPHLKHWDFHAVYGMYPEGLTLGETEEGFCHRCKNKVDKLEAAGEESKIQYVLIPLNPQPNTESGWAHVGDSWQRKGE